MRIIGVKEIKKYILTVADPKGNQSEIPIDETAYLHLKHAGVFDINRVPTITEEAPLDADSIDPEDWHLEMSKRFNNQVLDDCTSYSDTLRKAVGFGVVGDLESEDPGEFTQVDDEEDDGAQQL